MLHASSSFVDLDDFTALHFKIKASHVCHLLNCSVGLGSFELLGAEHRFNLAAHLSHRLEVLNGDKATQLVSEIVDSLQM